jgi:hypothetical protein
MIVHDLRPCWRVGLRPSRVTSGALPLAADVPSGVPMRMRSPCRHACSASASALHFARHPLLHGNVHSPVQTACPERAKPAGWLRSAQRRRGIAIPCRQAGERCRAR